MNTAAALCIAAPAYAFSPATTISLPVPIDTSLAPKCKYLPATTPTRATQLNRTFVDDFSMGSTPDYGPETTPVGWEFAYHWPGNYRGAHTHRDDEQQVYAYPSFPGTGTVPLGLNPFKMDGNGLLHIRAIKTPASLLSVLWGRPYYAGMITTRSKFSQTYGYFEIASMLPVGQGILPGFWLKPRDKAAPPELDVMEAIGRVPNSINHTVHWEYDTWWGYASCQVPVQSTSTVMHLYGALWTRDYIVFYIDRKPTAIIATPATMNVPMYMLLTLVVGGRWTGDIDATTPPVMDWTVDWVAAYMQG